MKTWLGILGGAVGVLTILLVAAVLGEPLAVAAGALLGLGLLGIGVWVSGTQKRVEPPA